MNPYRFKRRIELQQRTITVDKLGNERKSFMSWGKLWSDIKTVRGQEYYGAAQEKQNNVMRFIVRHSKTLDAFLHAEKTSFEIIFEGITYDVVDAINDDNLNLTITIIAEGRV